MTEETPNREGLPEPDREPNWRYFEGDARRQLEADRADHTAAIRGAVMRIWSNAKVKG